MGKTLILYYSKSGQNYSPDKRIVNLDKGYTMLVAETLKSKIEDADIFRIVSIKELPDDLKKFSVHEMTHNLFHLYPKSNALPTIGEYDTIYLCFPVYMGTLPTPVTSFLKHNKVKDGTIIYPIATSFGSGFKNSLKRLKKIWNNGEIKEGLSIVSKDYDRASSLLEDYLSRV